VTPVADLSTQTLPLLPLNNGVVLPGMVVTVTIETSEAQAAADAAQAADRELILVPKQDGRYASVGVVAKVENAGQLPNGTSAVIVRGMHRARIGVGVAGQ
jgi:ATP-dependent Lon protease